MIIVRVVPLDNLPSQDWIVGLCAGARACETSDGLSEQEVTTLARVQYHRSILCLCLDEKQFVSGFQAGYKAKKEGEI